MKKRVLYLSYDGMTDPLGQSQVLPYLSGLSAAGYHFTLISFEKPHRFSAHRKVIEGIASKHNIDWRPLSYTKNPPVVSTIKDVRRMHRLCVQLQKAEPFDIVHCRGHVPAIVGLYLKRKFKVRFLFDMRGFWADEKVDAGAWNLSNPVYRSVYRYFKKKEKSFLEESDQIVCLTHKAYEEMQKWEQVKLDTKKVTVIPCCVDTQLFDMSTVSLSRRQEVQRSLGIDDKDVIITYLGSIGTWYMLDEMLDFFKSFKKRIDNSRFLFITHDEHERIRQTADVKGLLSEDIIIRPSTRAEVPLLLSLSRFSLFFIRPSYSKMSSSPTKQGEIMAMGVPVVCNSGIGDTDRIVEQYEAGKLVNEMKLESFDKTITDLLSTNFDTQSIRNGALEFFSLRKGVLQYIDIYKKMFED